MRALVRNVMIPLCLLAGLLTGCGGDDSNEEGSPGTAPMLSDLSVDGDPMGTVGEVLSLSGSVIVADGEGDIANLLIQVTQPNGISQDLPPQHIGAPAGETMVSARFLVALQPPEPGTYRIDVRMDDDKGNVSAPLSFEVPVE